jgi:hypothetical protein
MNPSDEEKREEVTKLGVAGSMMIAPIRVVYITI